MKKTRFAVLFLMTASFLHAGNIHDIEVVPDDDFGYTVAPSVTSASTDPVGTIEGSFNVSHTGAAVYTMAIEAPKGLGNMQPAVGIAYNSQSGNGIAGWGTNITGFSVITRGMKDQFHDGGVKGMTFLADDAYFLDGKRLIYVSGTEGQEGAVYQLEGDPFTVITFHGYYNSVLADTWMDVRTPDGRYYEYGNSPTSRQYYTNKNGNSRIHAWYVCLQRDQDDNYIVYEYHTRNNYTYPTKVSYGKNMNVSNSILNTINFSYDTNRMDSVEFVMEDTKGIVDVRLREITTKTDNDFFRTYNFLYNTTGDSTITKFSRLSQVTVSNGNGDTFPATVFEWNPLASFSLQAISMNISLSDPNQSILTQNMRFANADVNGDGVDDIIRISDVYDSSVPEFKTYVYIHTSQINHTGNITFSSAERYSLSSSVAWDGWDFSDKRNLVFDFDGDGYHDLLFPHFSNSSQISFDILCGKNASNGIGAVSSLSYPLGGNVFPVYMTGDMNGDKRSDIIYIEKTLNSGVYPVRIISPSGGGQATFENYYFNLPQVPEKSFTGDFNNDGLNDIIIFYNGGHTIYYNNTGNNNLSRFSDFNKQTGTNFGVTWRMEQGDFNGDGLPDFLYVGSNSNQYYFALNNGDGTFTSTLALVSSLQDTPITFDNDKFSLIVRDIDSDGKSDVIIVKTMYTSLPGTTGVSWLLSDGSQLNQIRYVNTPVVTDSKWYNLMIGNFSGKGNMELMNYGCDLYTNTNATNSLALRLYKTHNYMAGTGKVQQITDGIGNAITVNYTSAPSVYTRHNDAVFPVIDVPVTFPMVRYVVIDNGAASAITTNYTYEGLKAHVQGKGLLGMKTVKTYSPLLEKATGTSIHNWNNAYFIPTGTTEWTALGTDTTRTITTYQITAKPYNNYLANPLTIRSIDFDGNVTETTNTYNTDYGYITSQETIYGENDDLYKTFIYDTYVQKGGRWLPTQITRRQKHYQDSSYDLNYTNYFYDEHGHLTKEIKNDRANLDLVTEHTYGAVGNVLSTKVSGYGVYPLTEYYTYDSSLRFVTSKYNSVVTSPICYTHDTWGNVTIETDNTYAPQTAQSVHYEYDGWGRLVRTVHADSTIVTRSFGWGTTQGKKYYVLDQGTATPWVVTWYDGMGRKVEIKTASNYRLLGDLQKRTYNARGLLSEVSSLCNGLSYTETLSYDSRGRVVSDSFDNGRTTTYTYGNRTVTESRNGQSYSKSYDAAGNLLTSTDPVSSVTYTYNYQWKPVTVSSGNATVEMEYDEAGNRITLTDPDAGTIEYTYDALGRVMSQLDARNKMTCNTYNALGQLTASIIDGVTTTYTYGTSGAENMQLKKITTNGSSTEFTYDALRRVVHKKQTIDNLDVLEYDYTYGANGKLSSTTYPDALTENYTYDSYGNRSGMSVNGTTLWEYQPQIQYIGGYTPLRGTDSSTRDFPKFPFPVETGRKDSWKLLNESLTLTELCDESGFLKKKALICGEDTISNLSYSYDAATGNLLSRTRLQQTETFTYDAMERLTGISLSGTPTATMTFGTNGNITSKTGLGNYSYDSNKKHAVVSVDNTSALLPLTSQNINYNGFGRIQSIAEGSYGMSFVYGPDQERWKTELRNGQNIVRTTLYGDGYERITENGTTRHFYYLEGGILCVKQDGQPDKFYYMNTDHQGSILSIVDANGSSVFEADYDAWGKQTVTLNTIGFHRGYTGHEMLPEFGLINMNGRLYNPDLGRFLSPDNFVQAPDFSQNFNRYTYCLNNPLKYTDPSGEFFGIDDLIVAGISFVAGYVSSGISTGHWGMSSVKSGLITAGMAWLGYNMPGISHSISNALATSMNIGINTTINTFMPFKSFPINSHFSISFAPMFGFGFGGLTAGFGVFAGYNNGDFSVQIGAGAGSLYSAWNAMATIDGWGGGFGKTFYTESVFYGNNISSQSTGTIALAFPNGTFSVSNDLWGDKQDRWRTTSAELAIGSISIGTYVSTNWGAEESEGLHYLDKRDDICGYNPNTNDKGLAWNNGKVFEAPLWLGLRHGNHINRIGYSHRYIQSLTQNFVHKNIVKTPYFLNYNSFNEGIFMYSGYNNPFTLWNR